jgi:hypothetical protein
MYKQKILNWVGGIWFLLNLPVIPFVGPAMYGILGEFFFDQRIPYAVVTFIGFAIILVLSKIWSGKYLKVPVILSLLNFLYAALRLYVVQDYLAKYSSALFVIIFIALVAVICIAAVKGMRGELNKKI